MVCDIFGAGAFGRFHGGFTAAIGSVRATALGAGTAAGAARHCARGTAHTRGRRRRLGVAARRPDEIVGAARAAPAPARP